MIRRLRIRFMVICMSIVSIVLILMTIAVNVVNYKFIIQNADEFLDVLKLSDDSLQNDTNPANSPILDGDDKNSKQFFDVFFRKEDKIITPNMHNTKVVTREEAIGLALDALRTKEKRGQIDNFRFLVYERVDGLVVYFVDFSNSLYLLGKFSKICIIIDVFTLVTLAIVAWLFSQRSLKPILDSYNKQRKFITNAGHELKTPLTIISANAEILELEKGEDESIDAIKKQVNRLNQMTKNLVTLSKIDEMDVKNENTLFLLTDDAIEIIESMKRVAENNNKTYEYHVEDDITYRGNERLIRELISIVLDNALKYSKSYININIYRKKNRIFIDTKNDTDNINKEDLKNLTNRFYRTANSRASSIEGSGIGLSIAQEIVSLHKGELKFLCEDEINFLVRIIL